MKTSSTITSIFLLLIAGSETVDGFTFMKNWKVPSLNEMRADKQIQEKFGDKKLAVITGSSSGLGRKAAAALLRTGEYHVIGAVRDVDKMQAVYEIDGWAEYPGTFTPMELELNSFDSVHKFCDELDKFKGAKPVDRLLCNAGVYQPSLPYPKWSMDGHEQTMQINFLSHFLMISRLMEDMSRASDPRIITVGSVTGNDNTVGGGGVYPIADLKNLDGFDAGFRNPIAMADGYGFIGAKAYKDSKLCLMMLANVLHAKYNKQTGIAFSSIYPGCIAESPLFREKRGWFRKYFPVFMKYITGGFVGEEEAGQRLFQVAHDPRCTKSGVYWSWNGGPREGRGMEALEKGGQISGGGGAGGGWDSIYENDQSAKVQDAEISVKLFKTATAITGAKWPKPNTIVSPCPTLKVIGAISTGMTAREEAKRMKERPGFDEFGNVIRPTKRQKVVLVADKVAGGVLRNTVGRVGRFVGRRVLGRIPETALEGSYQETKEEKDEKEAAEAEQQDAVAPEIVAEESSPSPETVPSEEKKEEETPQVFSSDVTNDDISAVETEISEVVLKKEKLEVNGDSAPKIQVEGLVVTTERVNGERVNETVSV
mmetsp:Transcript_7921/g.11811  ORF Transcript_7921/g.11811 Transcript_7921/m.11811 type:complete len:596 (-) Transcript_7921:355-2142(-)